MQMISGRFRAFGVILSVFFALALNACGGDSNTNNNPPDAANPPDDGSLPDGDNAPDANTDPGTLRSGTIAVVDIAVTNPGVDASGASVLVTYRDLTVADVPPTYGNETPDFGDCSVWVYNVGQDSERPLVDEGSVTIEGGLSPIGTCSFDAEAGGYRCKAGQGTIAATSVASVDSTGSMTLLFTAGGAPPANPNPVGMFMEISGFQNPALNGRFPITGRPTENSLVLSNPGAINQTETVTGTPPTYELYAGEGPTPAKVDFLGAETSPVMISKASGPIVAEFSSSIGPSGDGLTLADGSDAVHALPTTPRDVTFSCSPAQGGNCGPTGGFLYGFVLSGSTTDADLTGTLPTDMPPAVTQYATFQCRAMPLADTVKIPTDALAAILGTNPTRIRTQLLRITADLNKPQTSIVVGHGLVGFTDVVQ